MTLLQTSKTKILLLLQHAQLCGQIRIIRNFTCPVSVILRSVVQTATLCIIYNVSQAFLRFWPRLMIIRSLWSWTIKNLEEYSKSNVL